VNRDTCNTEWQRQQPDDRVQHESEQRERPAQEEKYDPQEKSSHGNLVAAAKRFIKQ
jgi:hypothetical protein